MHPKEALINQFYTSFQKHDYAEMVACYHPDVTFSDSVFKDLHGDQARAMWKMLLERGQDMQLTFRDVRADDQRGQAHWEAHYTYSATGRKVINRIDARFEFKDGQILHHVDHFDLWRWSAQALGTSGLLLGWTPFMQRTIQRKAAETLDRYIAAKK